MCRSYNARIFINIEIAVKQVSDGVTVQQQADIHDLCIGELPVMVGSVLCHRPIPRGEAIKSTGDACYFIVNGSPILG